MLPVNDKPVGTFLWANDETQCFFNVGEVLLVGALDCAVTNTHCVGCIKSGCSDE